MALVKCPECGKEVSTTAKVCPHCGANPNPKGVLGYIGEFISGTLGCLAWIIIFIVAAVVAALIFGVLAR